MWGNGRGQQPKPSETETPEPIDPLSPGSTYGTSISGLSKLAGVDRSTVQGWMRKEGFPEKLADGTYNAFEVGIWYREWKMTKAEKAARSEDGLEDGGPDSPALEIWRTQKAILAGFDVEEKRQTLVPRSVILQSLLEIALVLRESHERVKREFGNRAHELLEDALREARILINERFGADGSAINETAAPEDAGRP